MLQVVDWLVVEIGEWQFVMVGGVVLNCVMNVKICDCGLFDDVWV